MNDFLIQPLLTVVNLYKNYIKEGVISRGNAKKGLRLFLSVLYAVIENNDELKNSFAGVIDQAEEWANTLIDDLEIKAEGD